MLAELRRRMGLGPGRAMARLAPRVERVKRAARELAHGEGGSLASRAAQLEAEASAGAGRGEWLEGALALAARAAEERLGLAPYDEQLAAAMLLHEGHVVELATGEGKTLAIALAATAAALGGEGAHVVTTNEYLAERDARWMGPLLEALGRTVSVVTSGQRRRDKRRAYACDVVYSTASELAFDYLRDHLRASAPRRVRRPAVWLIVDEIDAIVVDAARAPFVIGRAEPGAEALYERVSALVQRLRSDLHYVVDRRQRRCVLTEHGLDAATELLRREELLPPSGRLFDPEHGESLHVLQQCLRAHALLARDRDYLVSEDGVHIVDPFTGRTASGRRWSDGLHQAVEAKEGLPVRPVQVPVASCSVRGLLALYERRAGATGTARGIEAELAEHYGMPVVRVPTHRAVARRDEPDRVFTTEADKLEALVEEVRRCAERGQPVLVGTPTEAAALRVSALLERRELPHRTLTARQPRSEASVVAEAGRPGAVTVATQVAGRGTDIRLGGDDEAEGERVRALGGLRVLGLERHAARRVDDQLRGRAGRQGDPGSSRIYVSLQDPLLRTWMPDRRRRALERVAGRSDERAAEAIGAAADEAQELCESDHAEGREAQRLLDGVLDEQRRAMYALRERLLRGETAAVERSAPSAPRPAPDPRIARRCVPAVERLLRTHIEMHGRLRPWSLCRDVYRLFGCEVSLSEPPHDASAVAASLGAQVALALSRQRDSLRRLVRETVGEAVEAAMTAAETSGRPEDTRHRAEQVYVELVGREPRLPAALELDRLRPALTAYALRALGGRIGEHGPRRVLRHARLLQLRALDERWSAHLLELGRLRDGLALRAYGARAPLRDHQREAHALFAALLDDVRSEAVSGVLQAETLDREELAALERELRHRARGARGAAT